MMNMITLHVIAWPRSDTKVNETLYVRKDAIEYTCVNNSGPYKKFGGTKVALNSGTIMIVSDTVPELLQKLS